MSPWRSGLRNTLLVARRQVGAVREDRYMVFLLGLVIALGVVAVLGARHHAASETEQRARYQTMVERQWAEQPDRHPHRVIHYGFLVMREEAPLSFFDPGVGAWAGTSLFLEGHRQNTANFGDARHATGMLRFGRLTPATVLSLLLPLFVVVAGFASVSAERERGTLRLLLAQGATPAQILTGKVLGTAAVAALAALPIGLATVAIAVSGSAGPVSMGRMAGLAGIYAAYLVGWVLLTVLVSSFRASSRSALAQLIAVWVVLCVAAPRLGAAVAGALHPLPSRAEFTHQVERALNEVGDSHDPEDPFFRSLRDEYLARYEVASVEELPVNWGGVVSREGEAITSRIHEEHRRDLVEGQRRQDRVLSWAGLLSPYLAARDLSMVVSGTDPAALEAFQAQAETYRYDLVQRLNDLHTNEIRYESDRDQRLSREHWAAFPTFRTRLPPLGRALAGRGVSLAALALWILLPLLGLGLARTRLARVGVERAAP
ncbi:MAG: DUF3526 domain-containing protein [Gammaproteobacteria bacterium]|nr:DUF3526 domain-containing protein [Gammaproteobacteria bacterium]